MNIDNGQIGFIGTKNELLEKLEYMLENNNKLIEEDPEFKARIDEIKETEIKKDEVLFIDHLNKLTIKLKNRIAEIEPTQMTYKEKKNMQVDLASNTKLARHARHLRKIRKKL